MSHEVRIHILPDGLAHPPCGIGRTEKTQYHDYDVTSIPSKVTCWHCQQWMEKNNAKTIPAVKSAASAYVSGLCPEPHQHRQ